MSHSRLSLPAMPSALLDITTQFDVPNISTLREGRRLAIARANKVGLFDKARLDSVATNKQILLSFTNRVRLDFAHTWVAHVNALKITNYLIGGTDPQAIEGLYRAGTQCFSMETNLPQGEWPWGSPSFKALGPHKIELIYKSITWGFEVIITDIDALVLREPFAYMARWPDAAFLTTSDHLGNTTSDQGLENHQGIHTAFNIGFMFFRAKALPLVEEWRRVIREQPRSRWDQGEFNRLARFQWKPTRKDGLSDPRLFWSYKNQLIGGVLPLALFAGGHNHFVSQFAQRAGWEPYSIHTTYQYAAAAGKRHRLREGKVWMDPPEYYDPPGGLLMFDPVIPRTMIYPPGGMDSSGHITLIKYQLKQIKSALAIAFTLGRKLIMPAVVCGYDKAWYPLSSGNPRDGFASRGVFPGSHSFILPIFNCPIDHFLEVGMMRPVDTIREYSLLSNPRMPEKVKASIAHVPITGSVGKAKSSVLPGFLSGGSEMARLRNDYRSAKVLNITNLGSMVAGGKFDAARDMLSTVEKAAFMKAFGFASGSWCCAPQADKKKGQPQSGRFRLME